MKTGVVYALCDPVADEVRYIGQTHLPLKSRMNIHMRARTTGTHVGNWIRSLRQRPNIVIVERVEAHDLIALSAALDTAEVRLIAHFRACGYDLTNGTDGGGGVRGWNHSIETRERIRAANLTPEGRERCRQNGLASARAGVWVGRKHTDETRAKMREAWKRRAPPTAETRAKISAALIGRPKPRRTNAG